MEELQPERDPARTPLFQVLAVLQNAPPARAVLQRLTLRSPELDPGVAKFDLMLDLTEMEERGGGLHGAFEYNTDLFDRGTIERLAGRFERALEAFATAPDRRLSELELLPENELLQAVGESARGPELAAPPTVLGLLAAQCERTPEAPAVVGLHGETLSYRELRGQALRLAGHLRRRGIGRGDRVAFSLDRGLELPVALLGILEAGAAYVPLDPAWPAERLRWMLEDAGAAVVLEEKDVKVAKDPDITSREGASLLTLPSLPSLSSFSSSSSSLSPDDLAYVIYTSGSTGRPKGIAMRHGALAQLIIWQVAAAPGAWRTLQYTSPSFDVSFQEMAATWAAGGTLVLISEEARRDALALLARLREEKIERLFLPFVALQQLAEAARGAELPVHLREVITAGEQLRVTPAVASFFARLRGARLSNQYGPAETHVTTSWVLGGDPAAWPALPPIGRPVAGALAVVVDLDGRPAPPGAPGELLLGGALLARGYLDQPRATAERFVPDPFSDVPGARLYRTGDRVRRRSDGALEYLGRLDTQVKIRGVRVEPGEVEAVLAAHPAVAAAAVVAREERPGDRRLVAWVVPAEGADIDARALRAWLAGRLPDALVPSRIASLATFPLTPSGKVDRRALARRAPEEPAEAAAGYVAPRTATEETLARLWAEVLGVERVGATDHFFDLGGHSLLGTQVVARVRDALGIELPLRALFEAPVLEDLAERIASPHPRALPPLSLPPPAGERRAPLSSGQHRLWFLDRLDVEEAAFNLPVALRLTGSLRPAALAGAFGEIVRRHEALRTTFVEEGGEPFQVVHPIAGLPPFALPVVDLSGLAPQRARREADRRGREEAGRPFSLAEDLPLRGLLFRLTHDEHDEHVVVTTLHHIAGDGWSLGILVREVGLLYGACVAGLASPLPPLPMQVADYAVWQRDTLSGERLAEQLAWWREALAGAPQVLEIPGDRPRPPVLSRRGAQRPFALSAPLTAELRALGRSEGATLFMTLLAGFAAVLGRWCSTEDLLVATPVAGRTRPELEGLIGFFVNDLPLRADLTGDPPFLDLVRRLRAMALGAFAHQDLPFERLVEEILEERSLSRHPLCQVAFSFQNTPAPPLTLPGLSLEQLPVHSGTAKLDLLLSAGEEGAGLGGAWEFSSDLFDLPTLDRFAGHLQNLLAAAMADPARPIAELPLLSAAEEAQIAEWNDTGPGETRDVLLHELFLAWAERRPDAPAVLQDGRVLTYATLRQRAERLSRRLRALGVGPETRVALCFDESIERIVAVLGVLLAGGAWVPLDPTWPTERLAWMLADAEAPVVLTREGLRGVLGETAAAVVLLEEEEKDSKDCNDNNDPFREGDSSLETLPSLPSFSLSPDHLAYLIYTSGSTGRPNGVMIRHRSVVNLIRHMIGVLGLGPGTRVLQVVSFSFDASVLEIWSALASGAALCIARREARYGGEELADEIRRHRITYACLVPSLLAQLPAGGLKDLRVVSVGGESCPAELAARWAQRVRLVNCYGPTEATVNAAAFVCTGADRREPPIGRPSPGVQLWVLDRHLRPVPCGVPGALWIAGLGLARGYLNRPELTAERFRPDPSAASPGARLYRSGDVARLRPDGLLEFLGRIDHQVKVRGVRIELGEIEAALQALPAVEESAVLLDQAATGERRLVAFVAAPAAAGLTAAALREALRERLPAPSIPAAFIVLERLPRTPVGKIDRKDLARRAAALSAVAEPARAVLHTATERSLAEIWASLLGLPGPAAVSPQAGFFDLGGHSLLATRLAARVRERWGIELSLLAVFEAPVFAELAARIDRELAAGAPAVPPLHPTGPPAGPGEIRRAPLSFAQQRLWFIDRLEPGSTAYNLPAALRLTGPLDTALLAGGLTAIARRHETLGTTFELVQGEPLQVIAGDRDLALPVADLAALPPAARSTEERRLTRAAARLPFDLARGPLFRALLLRLEPEEHVLLVAMHHIVSDGWSIGVLVRELGELYAAGRAGRPATLPPLPVQYADYAAWQKSWLHGETLDALLAWWREELADAPQTLDLPIDRPRPAVSVTPGAEKPFAVPAALAGALADLGRREGVTPFMTLLAGLHVLLGRHAGRRDLLIGAPVAHRTRAEIEPLIGFFINTLVHRGRLGGAPSFRTLLGRVRTSALGAFAHQDLPFERLVEELAAERSRHRTPLYQVLFVLQNAPGGPLQLPGLTLQELPLTAETAKTDLLLSLAADAETGGWRGLWEYSAALFDAATVERLGRSLTLLLAAAAGDPDAPIAALPLMSAEERCQVLEAPNRTAVAYPRELSLGALFLKEAHRAPDAVALSTAEGEVSRAELAERSGRIARFLVARGVAPEERIGLVAGRSPDLIAAVLGILRAGATWLPLDPSYPPQRLAWMLADAGARLLLAERQLVSSLPAEALPAGLAVCHLDEIGDREAPLPAVPAEALAYVMYTSGSTGTPKGVAVTHRNVIRLVRGSSFAAMDPGQVWLLAAPVSFDASTLEIWAPLLNGGRLALLPGGLASLDELARCISRFGLTSLWLTAGLFHQMVEERLEALRPLQQLLAGGDVLDPAAIRRVTSALPGLTVVNGYGPTEGTTFTTCHRMSGVNGGEPAGVPVPIGRPIANARVYLADPVEAELVPVPPGAVGELYAGGDGLARGYLGRPDRTAERFVPDPFSGLPGERLYRTGDRARLLRGGSLEFLGRLDGQVKIRGFRVEVGEVEAVLAGHPAVRQAVVEARDGVGGKLLAAWVTLHEPCDPAALQRYLRGRLPEPLVPTAWTVLEALPLTPNGKLDRRALPEPPAARLQAHHHEARTPLERDVLAACSEVLEIEGIGLDDNFFDLGGHSLLATRFLARLGERLHTEVPLTLLFDAVDLGDLAERITAQELARVDDGEMASLLAEIEGLSPEEMRALLGTAGEAEA